MAPCPPRPNCVSSDAPDAEHAVEAFALKAPPETAWTEVHEVIESMPRTRIVKLTTSYLHAECQSAVFHFVDDLELELRADEGTIAVRSASRLGYSDLGVNRERVERLRSELRARGAVR